MKTFEFEETAEVVAKLNKYVPSADLALRLMNEMVFTSRNSDTYIRTAGFILVFYNNQGERCCRAAVDSSLVKVFLERGVHA